MLVLPDLHSNVFAPILMEKQVPLGGKMKTNLLTSFSITSFFLPPRNAPLSPSLSLSSSSILKAIYQRKSVGL